MSLLSDKVTSEYKIEDSFVFNLEYVITDNPGNFKEGKVNLYDVGVDFYRVFGKNPLAVTLANNHAIDCGNLGFRDTVNYLQRLGVKYFGAGETKNGYNSPLIFDYCGHKIALIGFSMFNESDSVYGVNYYSNEKAISDIMIAKEKGASSIFVNIHWGVEESPYHTSLQRKIGHFLIDSGVDLVIGHHPHCIQPFEKYREKYIFYSLGNCVFPSFEVESFFDEKGIPQRIYRKRQLRHNKESLSVTYDLETREVVTIEKLRFSGNVLRKLHHVNLEKKETNIRSGNLVSKTRKLLIFLRSNTFVKGKLFDLSALHHEMRIRKGRNI